MSLVRSYNELLSLPTRPKPPHLLARAKKRTANIYVSQDARIGGVLQIAPSGWGKSLWLAKTAFQDCANGLGQVVLDISGEVTAGFFNELVQATPAAQELLLKNIVYCNMAGMDGFVPSFPMLHPQRRNEPLSQTAHRIPQLLSQIDVNFATATIQGLPRTLPLASSVCKILTALHLPLAHAQDLLLFPELWQERIAQAAVQNPEAALAAEELMTYMSLPRKERELRSEPFRNRLYLLQDRVNRAMLSSTRAPAVDWERIAWTNKTCLIDLSTEHDPFAKQWKLLYIFNSLCEYIQSRGRAVPPLGLLIDEISYVTRGASLHASAIIEQLRELIEVRSRNNRCFLILSSQNLSQLHPDLKNALLQLKTHMYGAVLDYTTSIELARRFITFNLDEVKYWQRVWASDPGDVRYGILPRHFVIDHTPIFRPMDEQLERNRRVFADLKKGEWLLAQSHGEGQHAVSVRKVVTPKLYTPPFPADNAPAIRLYKRYFTRTQGVNIAAVLAEIEEQRLHARPASSLVQPETQAAQIPAEQHSKNRHLRSHRQNTPDTPAVSTNGHSKSQAPVKKHPEQDQRSKASRHRMQGLVDAAGALSPNGKQQDPASPEQPEPAFHVPTKPRLGSRED